jgi:hypothetical protein
MTMAYDPPLPADFPVGPYEAVQKRVSVDLKESHPDSRGQFAGGWNALRYRYQACDEHDREFTRSIQSEQTPRERYIQERELFGFFVSGQSAIESLCYSLHAIASVIKAVEFPIQTKEDLKRIDWPRTKKLVHPAGPAHTNCK